MLITGLYSTETFDQEGDRLVAQIRINPEHLIFKGHFPGKPVMPGVCMIQIIKELSERSIGQPLLLTTASNVKFMAIINPFTDPVLTLEMEIVTENDLVKLRNTTSFGETVALKLGASFKTLT